MSCAERVNPCACRIGYKSVSRFPSAYNPPPTTMKLHSMLVPLALLTVAASAQTTVYSTNFSSGALRTSGSTYNTGDWTLASTKNTLGGSGSGSASLSGSGLAFGMASTTSGFVETQTRFTDSPITLTNINDYVQLKIAFTNNAKVVGGTAGTSSSIAIGLFDTGGSGNRPAIGLQTSGLTTASNSSYATGNAANWEGYAGRITPNSGTNQIYTRPLQSGTGTTSANQEVLYNNVGGGAYTNPTGVQLGTATSTLSLLSDGQKYNATLKISLTNSNEYTVLFSLADSSNNEIQSISKLATNTTFISGLSFDGLAFGYRNNSTPGQATGLTLTSVEVTNYSAVPEPANVAALIGLAGLAAVGLRRKHKA